MVKRHVRVYIEGGAHGKTADSDFRRGWKSFLKELHEFARAKGFQSLEVVRGKGRDNAFGRFKAHKQVYPNDVCALLVDAEVPVPNRTQVWDVVRNREGDGWERPSWATDAHLYLMVHFVETWLLTDQVALQRFFKRGFNQSPLPTTNLEARSKALIDQALKKATDGSSKGQYRHGQAHEIIELVRPDLVRTLKHGQRLFVTLKKLIEAEAKPD